MSEINWKPRYLVGRLVSGRELGKGKTVHAVPVADGWRALCGVRPGPRSAGWTENTNELEVDCMRCLNVISMDAAKLAQQSPPQLMNEILRKALYEVNFAPISREEMIEVADKALAKCVVIEYPVSPTVQWGATQTPADRCEHGVHGTDCLDCYPVGTTKG